MGLVVFKKNGDMHGSMKDEYGNGCEKVGSGYEDGEINGFRKMRKWYEGWVVREMRIDGLRWKLWQ